jgi:hypothetical protein
LGSRSNTPASSGNHSAISRLAECLRKELQSRGHSPRASPSCGGQMELDRLPEIYFSFLRAMD